MGERERIKWIQDESLYQPKIRSERIRELYRLKILTHIPMTVLVDMAITEFIEKMEMQLYDAQEYKCEIEEELTPWNDPEDLSRYLEPYQNDPFGDL